MTQSQDSAQVIAPPTYEKAISIGGSAKITFRKRENQISLPTSPIHLVIYSIFHLCLSKQSHLSVARFGTPADLMTSYASFPALLLKSYTFEVGGKNYGNVDSPIHTDEEPLISQLVSFDFMAYYYQFTFYGSLMR
ncbi:MAG: hypothetical protein LBB04_03695 [Oscillospiraceae bacterium]|jgi:hypothetical protein|nr:hypothetical protein [Oscillospiraceae bacterium]